MKITSELTVKALWALYLISTTLKFVIRRPFEMTWSAYWKNEKILWNLATFTALDQDRTQLSKKVLIILSFICGLTASQIRELKLKNLYKVKCYGILKMAGYKGQLISKELFKVFICTKKRTKIFLYFCPSL